MAVVKLGSYTDGFDRNSGVEKQWKRSAPGTAWGDVGREFFIIQKGEAEVSVSEGAGHGASQGRSVVNVEITRKLSLSIIKG